MEEWKTVPDTNGLYAVSSHGRARRVDTGRILRTSPAKRTGYPRITLSVGGKIRVVRVHQLVAAAFLGPRPTDHDVNHRDGDKTNNRADNLEYVTRKQHEAHTRNVLNRPRGPQGETHPHARLTEEQVREIHRLYAAGEGTQKQIANRFGVSLLTVNSIVTGQHWRHLNLPRVRKDYHLRGLDNPNGKVTPEMRDQIRSAYAAGTHTYESLAQLFDLGKTTISRVVKSG